MASIIKTTSVDSDGSRTGSCEIYTGVGELRNVHSAWLGRVAATALLPFALAGCEAALNLEGVEAEQEKQVRRTDQFQGVAVNDTAMVVVGADGLVLTSPVGQTDWLRQELEGAPALVDVAACPDQGFVALSMDKRVWFSADHGQSWTPKALDTAEDVLAITCAPDNGVWVVGSFSTVLNSSDAGDTWSEASFEEDAMLTSIEFLDATTVFVTGEFGLISRSDDGGKNWNAPEFIPNDFYTQGAHFTSANSGWVAGLSGQILYTEDAGASWQRQAAATESPLYGFYQSGERLFAYGDHAVVLEFDGSQWQRFPNKAMPVYIRDAEQLTDGRLLLAGGFGSLYTLDIAAGGVSQISQK